MSLFVSEETANKALELHQKILETKKLIGLNFLYCAKFLYEMREGGYYKIIQPDFSWNAYLALPEVSISPSHAVNLLNIYRRLVLELKVPVEELGIDQRKLTALVPVATIENVEQLLAEARSLTRKDLIKNIKELKAGEHEHIWHSISFERCNLCFEQRNYTKQVI